MNDPKTEAYLNGWHAHRLEYPTHYNPYSEYTQSYSHSQWLSGWCDRFSAVKHGHNLSLDTSTL